MTTEAPHMVVDPGADPAIAKRIAAIDRAIDRDPEQFVAAMSALGAQATSAVIERDAMDMRVPTASRKPDALIKEFLNNRLDLDCTFDDPTEDAIASDEVSKALLKKVQQSKSVSVKTGAMSSIIKPSPEADSARDELRRHRFSMYLSRKATYHAQQSGFPSAV